MNWGGLRNWGDMGTHGLNNTYQWAQTITGTSPSWYVQFKSSASASNTFTWWLVADTDGKYRFHLLTGADIGTSYQAGVSGIPNAGHQPSTMFQSPAFDPANAFGRHDLPYVNTNSAVRLWATPEPGIPSSSITTSVNDKIAFKDGTGTSVAGNGYENINGTVYRTNTFNSFDNT